MTPSRSAEASAAGTMEPSLTDGDANYRPDSSNMIIGLERSYYGCVMKSASDDVDPDTTPNRGDQSSREQGAPDRYLLVVRSQVMKAGARLSGRSTCDLLGTRLAV